MKNNTKFWIALLLTAPMTTQAKMVDKTLFCGYIRPGCEDVSTNTLEIRFKSKDQIELIRMYHESDLPISSAFTGKLKNDHEIIGTYDSKLTKKNSRQSQSETPNGKVSVTLQCKDLKTLKDCKVTGHPLEGTIVKFPGWEDKDSFRNNPTDLSCNTKAIQELEAPNDCGDN